MNLKDLKPVSTLVQRYGVKTLAYGPPGGGKTPLITTAPRPVLLITEPGILSMRDSNIPAFEAYTPGRIDEFFKWLKSSNELKSFDTICVDSISQLAEIELTRALANNRDGRKAYGVMSQAVMEIVDFLYFMPEKHIYIIAKEAKQEEIVWSFSGPMPVQTTVFKKVPYFPGQDLSIKVPHRYDEIVRIAKGTIPGVAGEHKFIRSSGPDAELLCRDRSGKLNEYEPHNLSDMFRKIMN